MPNAPAADPLSQVFMRLERRRRGVVLGRGIGLALAIAAVGGLLGIGLDLLFFLAQPARWLVWGTWLGSIGWILGLSAFRAFGRPADLLALASRAEHGDPASAPLEALTAAVSLARNPHGSPALIAALADQAAGLIRGIEPRAVIPGRPAIARLVLGACLFGLLVAPALLAPPGAVRTRVRRFLSPWANLERAGAFAIVVEPGDGRAALGSRPTIRVEARGNIGTAPAPAPDEAWIEWRDAHADGRPQRLAMAGDSGRFSASLPRLNGSLRYRAVVGSGADAGWGLGLDAATSASPWFRLDAVEPPTIAGLRVTVEPPAYTKLPARTITLADGPATIEAWQDSRIVLDLSASARLRSASVDFEADGSGVSLHPGTIAADGRSASATLRAEASGNLAISLVDEAGIAGEAGSLHRLAVRIDAPPTVSVEELDHVPDQGSQVTRSASTDGSVEARPDDVVRIGVTAADDLGVASAELRYEVERVERGTGTDRVESEPVPVSTSVSVALELKPLGLRPGDRLTYRVRVADNRPPPRGPNVTWSGPRSISIVKRADTLAQRRREAARAALQARLDAVKRAAAKLRQEAERLRYAADAARLGSGPWDKERQLALAGREDEAGELIDDLQGLANAFETRADPRGRPDPEADFHALAPAAREAAGREGESSRAALERARRAQAEAATTAPPAEAASKRLDALRQADAHLAGLATRLDELQARFDATSPKGKAGQGEGGGEGRRSELASKESASPPGAGQQDQDADPLAAREGKGEKPGEANGSGGKMGDKRQAGRPDRPGKPGNGSAPAGYPAPHEEAEAESGSGDLATLRDSLRGRSGRPWAELPGQLRSKILRMPQVRFRDEYSRQIERYYRELAEPTRAGRNRPDE